MSLTPSQVEDFTRAFFADHRLPVPRIRFCAKPPRLTMRARKTLSLPHYCSRSDLAHYIAARLCREIIRRDSRFRREIEAIRDRKPLPKWMRPKLWRHFEEWHLYVRGVVNHHFGEG